MSMRRRAESVVGMFREVGAELFQADSRQLMVSRILPPLCALTVWCGCIATFIVTMGDLP